MPSLFTEILKVSRHDLNLLHRLPRLRYAALGAALIPALYALIYLSSVWDPVAHTSQLPVGLVQEDQGTTYRNQQINIGAELIRSLDEKHSFDYRHYNDPESARLAVRQGHLIFALIVPRDFSLHAVPGREAGGGKLVIYTSEGNSYNGAGFARRFAPELADRVNEALNEKRWSLVLERAAGSAQNLDTLRGGMQQLHSASAQLADGTSRAKSGSRVLYDGLAKLIPGGIQLTDGFRQTGAGLRQMRERLPSDETLAALRNGASTLARNTTEIGDGLHRLHAGASKLTSATTEFKNQSDDIPLVGSRIASAAAELEAGAQQLQDGLEKAHSNHTRLAEGAHRLEGGVTSLTEGTSLLGNGLNTMLSQFPADSRLAQFNTGLNDSTKGMQTLNTGLITLDDGAARLKAGIALIYDAMPRENPQMDGSPSGLAHSVEPELEIVAPVANNGTGFAVNFVPLALWVGAVMSAFLFQLRQVPLSSSGAPQLAILLGKMVVPGALSLLQSLVMLLMLIFVLDIGSASTVTFALTLACASLTFLSMIFALIRVFGELGKALSVLLLILQLSSAGALMPIELTSQVFQILHPLLPFSWVVRAFRASLFGAYDGAWLLPWSVAVLGGAIGLLIAHRWGRWKIVADDAYQPGIELNE